MNSIVQINPNDSLKTSKATWHNSLWQIFFSWLGIGIQSFGGGSATFFLIHQTSEKYGWISEEEFLNAWALAQLSPGINLIKLTVFIGFRLRRWAGIVVAMAGLLIPSAIVTVLMTSVFTLIKGDPTVKAVMRGILPATIGMALAMGVQITSPVLKLAYREGRVRFILHLLLITAASLTMAGGRYSPALILLASGIITVLMLMMSPIKKDVGSEKEAN
jgi:chromate transporter